VGRVDWSGFISDRIDFGPKLEILSIWPSFGVVIRNGLCDFLRVFVQIRPKMIKKWQKMGKTEKT
jgi:hypothetical protein